MLVRIDREQRCGRIHSRAVKTVHSFHDLAILQSPGAAWLQEDLFQILDENGKKISLEEINGPASRPTSELSNGSEVQPIESFIVAHDIGGAYETRRITLEQLFQLTDLLTDSIPLHSDAVLLVQDGQAYKSVIRRNSTIAEDSHSVYDRMWAQFGAGNRGFFNNVTLGAISVNNNGTVGAVTTIQTSTTANSTASVDTQSGMLLERNPNCFLKGRHNGNNETDTDFWFGFTGTVASAMLDDDEPVENYAGIQLRQSRGDTTYKIAIGNGTIASIIDTGLAPVFDTGSVVNLGLWYSTETERLHFQANEVLIGEYDGPFPAQDTNLLIGLGVKTLTSAARGYFVESLGYSRDKLWTFVRNGTAPGTTGMDDFSSYATGTVTTSSVLNGGTNWGSPWTINDYNSDVKLLTGFEGTNGTDDFVDESNFQRAITPVGNAQLTSAQFKYGASSGLFDGTGDRITIPHSTDFNSSTPFTVECWVRLSSLIESGGSSRYIAAKTTTFTSGFVLGIRRNASDTGTVFFAQIGNGSDVNTQGTILLEADRWYHVAQTYDGSVVRLFVDGILDGTSASVTPTNNTALFVIGDYQTSGRAWAGWIDEFRFSGTCWYTSNFTPPSGPFPRP